MKYLLSENAIINLERGDELYGPEKKRFVRDFTAIDQKQCIYFVLFGRLIIKTKTGENLGGRGCRLSVGSTLGEEVLFDVKTQSERAIAECVTCVLQVSVDSYNKLNKILLAKDH